MDEDGFTLKEALAAQAALRSSLGLGEERFPVPAFVGMISDEIQQAREAGRTDAEIAAAIEAASGKRISAEELSRYYASEAERGHGGGRG